MLSKRAQENEEADETHGNEKPVRLANNTVCRVAILADRPEIKIEAPLSSPPYRYETTMRRILQRLIALAQRSFLRKFAVSFLEALVVGIFLFLIL